MVYRATAQRRFISFCLGVALIVLITSWGDPIFVAAIPIVVFCCFIFFVRYEFDIRNLEITFRAFIFNFQIYERKASPNDMQEILFKRAGWSTKSAIVKLKKGWNMRIALFSPKDVFAQLEVYAEKNKVSVRKTKDYRLLENLIDK